MKQIEEAAKVYCEKNIPSMEDMHFTISQAFEAGAEFAQKELKEEIVTNELKEYCKSPAKMLKLAVFAASQIGKECIRMNAGISQKFKISYEGKEHEIKMSVTAKEVTTKKRK